MKRPKKTSDRIAVTSVQGTAHGVSRDGLDTTAWLSLRLYLVAFLAGFVILGLEILGFRMFAPYFGYSVYVSGALVSLVLIALTAGYYLGGIVADRWPTTTPLFLLVLAASGYLAIVSVAYPPLLSVLSRLPPVAGTSIAALAIFAPPMLLLSTATPFCVKLISTAARTDRLGAVVGAVSAVSTLGSIVGSLATTFLLIPVCGVKTTLVVLLVGLVPAMLLLGAFSGRWLRLFSVVPVVAAGLSFARNELPPGLIFREESAYNTIKVYERGGTRQLVLNRDFELQTEFNKAHPFGFSYVTHFLAALPMAGGTDLLILGLGGGTSANQTRLVYPAARVEAVEIDPVVCDVAERYFRVKEYNPSLRIHTADARAFPNRCDRKYDAIEVDMFQGGAYAPFYVTTREFFAAAKRHLKPGGVLACNVLRTKNGPDGEGLCAAVANTLLDVYPSVFMFQSDRLPYNALLFAVAEPVSLDALKARTRANLQQMPRSSHDPSQIVLCVLDHLSQCRADPTRPILTDDHAPIESLTHAVLHAIETAPKSSMQTASKKTSPLPAGEGPGVRANP